MAHFHTNSNAYINRVVNTQAIIMEIGSDRNEGSTSWFDNFAKIHKQEFYSVDVIDDAQRRHSHLDNTNFIICESGSSWTATELTKLNKKINILYLDNYDWGNYPIGVNEKNIIKEYAERGVEWSTFECQKEHLAQMVNCLPYMTDKSVVICDDTPFIDHAGIYFGKCSAVVPYLCINGYEVVFKGQNGVILTRGV